MRPAIELRADSSRTSRRAAGRISASTRARPRSPRRSACPQADAAATRSSCAGSSARVARLRLSRHPGRRGRPARAPRRPLVGAPTQGFPLGDGLTPIRPRSRSPSTSQTPVAAAIEAVDRRAPLVLGVRAAVAEADPVAVGRSPPRRTRTPLHPAALLANAAPPRGPRRDGVARLLSARSRRARRRPAGHPPVQPRPRRRRLAARPPTERVTT